MREKVAFLANIPVTVALEYAEGKQVESQYGEQFYYSLVGDKCMYVHPIVEKQIRELGIPAREEFEICKRVIKEGRKDVTRWVVGFLGTASPHGQIGAPKPAERRRETESASNPHFNPAAARQADGPDEPVNAALPVNAITTRRQRMTAVLVDCIHAVEDASTQAGRKFDGEQFQKLVSSFLIDQLQRGEHAVSLPPAKPRPATTNGHVNGNGASPWTRAH